MAFKLMDDTGFDSRILVKPMDNPHDIPTEGMLVQVNYEVMKVLAIVDLTGYYRIHVVRGHLATTMANHSAGTDIKILAASEVPPERVYITTQEKIDLFIGRLKSLKDRSEGDCFSSYESDVYLQIPTIARQMIDAFEWPPKTEFARSSE